MNNRKFGIEKFSRWNINPFLQQQQKKRQPREEEEFCLCSGHDFLVVDIFSVVF